MPTPPSPNSSSTASCVNSVASATLSTHDHALLGWPRDRRRWGSAGGPRACERAVPWRHWCRRSAEARTTPLWRLPDSGAPCSFLSRISVDAFGDALLLRLRESDVGTDLVQRGPEPTSLAVVALACDGSARYSFYTDGTADRLVRDPGALPESAWHSALGFAPERRRSPSHAGAPNRRPWRRWAPSDTGWHAGSHPRWCASPRVGGARHANSGVGLL